MGCACHTINHEVNHLVNFMPILASSMPNRLWGLYGADTCLTRIKRELRYIESLHQPGIQHAHLEESITVEGLTAVSQNTAVSYLGIEFLEIGDDYLTARVPVDPRTHQPYGLLHGGVSVVLAETLGSCGAACACEPGSKVVGLDINANHLKGVSSGWVTGTARPVHIGRTTQVWQIDLRNEAGELTCVSRITMAVLAPR